MYDRTFKLILPAKDIENESTVTKRTGQKEYTLIRSINIYNNKGSKQTIDAEKGAVFLADERGNFSAYSGDTELVWCLSYDELYNFVTRR